MNNMSVTDFEPHGVSRYPRGVRVEFRINWGVNYRCLAFGLILALWFAVKSRGHVVFYMTDSEWVELSEMSDVISSNTSSIKDSSNFR